MEENTRKDLYEYLLAIQKAVKVKNRDVDPKAMSEEEWADFCMREGAARLAGEIIQRFGLTMMDN